jgi:hypothetical protein
MLLKTGRGAMSKMPTTVFCLGFLYEVLAPGISVIILHPLLLSVLDDK